MARGLEASGQNQQPVSLRELFICKPLLIFAAAITLYHFANAAMLPILGQKLAQSHLGSESLVIAACIITAQIIMVPMTAGLAKADLGGTNLFSWWVLRYCPSEVCSILCHKTRFIWCRYKFSTASVLVSLAHCFSSWLLTSCRELRYGFAFACSQCMGLGAVLSHAVTGFIVDSAGFDVAFLFLATIALMALLLYWLAMPETGVFIAKNNEAM